MNMMKMRKTQQSKYNHGAASIFLVIFTMIIISTVVLGFTGIMLRDQSQASDMDLSKSAYDSALAGVEDAKRAITKYNLGGCTSSGSNGPATVAQCNTWRAAFSRCNSNSVILYGASSSSNAERIITTSASSTAEIELNQAYTCVKTTLNTPDYVGTLQEDEQILIPLQGVGAFNQVKISWFTRDNVNREIAQADRDKVSLESPFSGLSSPELPYNNTANWPKNRPPLLKAQYIQVPASFSLTDFDEMSADGTKSNTNTIFMYPVSGSGTSTNDGDLISIAPRFDNTAEPWQVACRPTVSDDGYACNATLTIPPTLTGTVNSAYLALRPFYNLTNYKVELLNSNAVVDFSGVQPKIDSTGRANDIFRRVAARVESANGASLMPLGAVETSGNFCKTFSVTDTAEGYNAGSCTP